MKDKNVNINEKDQVSYGYYSRVLKEPFDSLDALKLAEEAYYAKQKAKEAKSASKKADAQKVEDAFKKLNAARKDYKTKSVALAEAYREELEALKKAFESAKADIKADLSAAETCYSTALKEFTEKYPEGFHLTLKDGDFETTIDTRTATNSKTPAVYDLFDLLFRL